MDNILIDEVFLVTAPTNTPSKFKTVFGMAKLDASNHYYISSRREGNHGKLLHRLIYESYYNMEIPKGFQIHHRNNNPLDNHIENLEMLSQSEHMKHHANNMSENHRNKISKSKLGKKNAMYGKPHSKEHRKKQSKALTSTGIFHVRKAKDSSYKKGYKWCYEWQNSKNKPQVITRASLFDLRDEVLKRGLEWEIVDEDKAKAIIREESK